MTKYCWLFKDLINYIYLRHRYHTSSHRYVEGRLLTYVTQPMKGYSSMLKDIYSPMMNKVTASTLCT